MHTSRPYCFHILHCACLINSRQTDKLMILLLLLLLYSSSTVGVYTSNAAEINSMKKSTRVVFPIALSRFFSTIIVKRSISVKRHRAPHECVRHIAGASDAATSENIERNNRTKTKIGHLAALLNTVSPSFRIATNYPWRFIINVENVKSYETWSSRWNKRNPTDLRFRNHRPLWGGGMGGGRRMTSSFVMRQYKSFSYDRRPKKAHVTIPAVMRSVDDMKGQQLH